MLIKIKRLVLKNTGTDIESSIEDMYINTNLIQTVTKYPEINQYLESHPQFQKEEYSLIIYGNSEKRDIIAQGNPDKIFNLTKKEKSILRD